MKGRTMKLIELSEVEILIMKSIWKLGDGITVYEIIDYLDQVYDRKYTRSTVKTYITKLKKKGFVDTTSERQLQLCHSKDHRRNVSWRTDGIDEGFLAWWVGEGIGSDVNTHDIKRRKRRIKGFDQWFGWLKNIYLCHQYDTAEWFGGKYFVYGAFAR